MEACEWLVREDHEGVTLYKHPTAPLWVKVDRENGIVTLEYDDGIEDYIQELLDSEDSEEDARDILDDMIDDMVRCAVKLTQEHGMLAEGLERARYDILALFDDLAEEQV